MGTLVQANPAKPRRVSRLPIAAAIDLTVTPPQTGAVAGEILPGEMCYLTANHKVASLNTTGASNANAADFVGVAVSQYPVTFTDGISGSPIPSSDPNVPMVTLLENGDFLFYTTAADTYNAYDTVYLGAASGAQNAGRTVQKTASGTAVGYVSPDQRQSGGLGQSVAPFPITGAVGVLIYVRIQPALVKGN